MKKENVVKVLIVGILIGSLLFLSKKLHDSTTQLSESVQELSVKVEKLDQKLDKVDDTMGAVQHQMFLDSLEAE